MAKNWLRTSFKDFEISARFKGEKCADFDDDSRYRHYLVTIMGGNINNKNKIQFDFWTSRAQPEMQGPKDLIRAFEAFLGDAMAGLETDYQRFCLDCGYNPFDDGDPKGAWKAFKGCQRSLAKWKKLTDLDVCDVYYELTEAA